MAARTFKHDRHLKDTQALWCAGYAPKNIGDRLYSFAAATQGLRAFAPTVRRLFVIV